MVHHFYNASFPHRKQTQHEIDVEKNVEDTIKKISSVPAAFVRQVLGRNTEKHPIPTSITDINNN